MADTIPTVVEINGRRAQFADGEFTGDERICGIARIAVEQAAQVDVLGFRVTAGTQAPLNAAAAMLAYSGGAGWIVSGPEGAFEDLEIDADLGEDDDSK